MTDTRGEPTLPPTQSHGEATLHLPDGPIQMPLVMGTEGEVAIDISRLRKETGVITLDDGFRNTGACRSAVTFIDGEQGILRYRGYPIEQVAEHTSFPETALLLIQGEPATGKELLDFSNLLTKHALLHEGLRHHFDGFPPGAPPMAILSAMINAISCYHPDLLNIESEEALLDAVAKLISKIRTIAAYSYKKNHGEPLIYTDPNRDYCANFLHMMFSLPYSEHHSSPEVIDALRIFLILHADHEQNCSTSTARIVGSSGANLFACVSAAVCALWGPLHGGANTRVIEQLESIERGDVTTKELVESVKNKKALMWGFGHRVYKNFDPRVKLLKTACNSVLESQGISDPLLDIAFELEDVATHDPYFLERRLYPNVDFYSGILLRAIGIPVNMFPVMFAIGRLPGWIAHWVEGWRHGTPLYRPRQVYVGPTERSFVPIDQR